MADTTETTDFESTINFLKGDLASASIPLAVNIIERWEHRLQDTQMFEDLRELKQALLEGNTTELKQYLNKLSDETEMAAAELRAQSATDDASQIGQIGKLLAKASEAIG